MAFCYWFVSTFDVHNFEVRLLDNNYIQIKYLGIFIKKIKKVII